MMRFVRHIALWLAGAIVSIVVALSAAPASAHVGHGHAGHGHGGDRGARAVAGPVAAAVVPVTVALRREATPPGARAVLPSEVRAFVAVSPADRPAGHASCCAACGHAGSVCCAVALAPGEAPALPGPGRLADASRRELPSPASIVPEAQAEPPRSFA